MIPTYALAAWTLFVWGTRLRNAVDDGDGAGAFVVPVILVVVAVAAIARPARWSRLLALASSFAWLVRVPVILAQDFSVGFKVVHTALAVITWLLAWWVLARERGLRPAPA